MTLPATRMSFAAVATICVTAITGCGEQSSAWMPSPGPIDCEVEVQIAVRSQPYSEGDVINDGNFKVLSTTILPIKSNGGRGHVVSKNDEAVVELHWDAVTVSQMRKDQHHEPKLQIEFENCRLEIKNDIVRPDGTSHRLGAESASWIAGEDYELKFSPITFTADDDNERAIVVRTRLIKQATKAASIDVGATLNAETDGE